MAKLNIGAGENPLPGWTNVDIGGHPGTLRMDATQPFPFASGEFTHVFCEHALEHMVFPGAISCLRECFRTLVPGGRIRVSIPHLDMLIRLYENQDKDFERSYIEWHCKTLSPGAPVSAETVWNNFFRLWGHQFMWSRGLLQNWMKEIGFRVEGPFLLGTSPDPDLRFLENSARMPLGFLQLETVTLEGIRPYA